MNKEKFTQNFLDFLKSKISAVKFTAVNDLQIYTKNISGYELNVFLQNAYDMFRSGTETLEQTFENQLGSINKQIQSLSEGEVKTILPVLKPRDYIEIAKKQLKDSGYGNQELPFYYEKLNDDIYQLYVFDFLENMRFVTPDDIEKHGIKETIKVLARKNMEMYFLKLGAEVSEIATEGNGRVYIFEADGSYESSLLVAIKYLETFNLGFNDSPVIFMPARSFVMIVDSVDKKGIAFASSTAKKVHKALGYPISPHGYILKNGEWIRCDS